MDLPFYRQPRFLWGVGTVLLTGLLLALYVDDLRGLFQPFQLLMTGGGLEFGPKFWRALVSLGYAIAAPLLARYLFTALVSQFVLPVNTLEQRKLAWDHFVRFSSGLPGPAIFVENGQLVASAAEREHRNLAAGVILVDSASGVVLRTDTELTRAEGPGVVFTRSNEYLEEANALDLRKQSRRVEQAPAITRDGILIKANINVTFVLDSGEPKPLRDWSDPAQPPYGFSRENAAKAVYGRTYRDKTQGEWAELPGFLAADVWRELLIQRDFEPLFSATDTSLTLLDGLQYQIQSRLMGIGTDEDSRERQVLADRGLRVMSVSLSGLTLPEEVKKKRLENWREDWKNRAGAMEEEKDPGRKQHRQKGKIEGRTVAVETLTQYVRDQLKQGRRPFLAEVAVHITEATRKLAQDSSLNGQGQQGVSDLQRILMDMELWAKRLRADSSPEAK